MHVTLKTIAQQTGYSITTISRALTGHDDVAKDTRQLILETAERLGYRPNELARQLRFQRANTIGLIIPTFGPRFSDPFFSEFLAGVGDQAAEHKFDLLVSTQAPGPGELSAYHRMEGGRVDGLTIVRTRYRDPRISYLRETKIPFVAFGRSNEENFPYVDVDGELGMRLLVQHFIDLGHRRIGYIAPPLALNFSRHRLAGYRAALEANGLPHDQALIVPGDLTQRSGAEGTDALLQLDPPPTAILAGNDTMAFGVMSVIRRRGLEVGTDVAVGGFDDVPDAEYSNPPLTTVRQPIYEIGRCVCEMLLQIIRGEAPAEDHVLFKPELAVRESSGNALAS
jgi:LacI family transcriptional regulator